MSKYHKRGKHSPSLKQQAINLNNAVKKYVHDHTDPRTGIRTRFVAQDVWGVVSNPGEAPKLEVIHRRPLSRIVRTIGLDRVVPNVVKYPYREVELDVDSGQLAEVRVPYEKRTKIKKWADAVHLFGHLADLVSVEKAEATGQVTKTHAKYEFGNKDQGLGAGPAPTVIYREEISAISGRELLAVAKERQGFPLEGSIRYGVGIVPQVIGANEATILTAPPNTRGIFVPKPAHPFFEQASRLTNADVAAAPNYNFNPADAMIDTAGRLVVIRINFANATGHKLQITRIEIPNIDPTVIADFMAETLPFAHRVASAPMNSFTQVQIGRKQAQTQTTGTPPLAPHIEPGNPSSGRQVREIWFDLGKRGDGNGRLHFAPGAKNNDALPIPGNDWVAHPDRIAIYSGIHARKNGTYIYDAETGFRHGNNDTRNDSGERANALRVRLQSNQGWRPKFSELRK